MSDEKYTFDGYILELTATGILDSYGHEMVKYTFTSPKGVILFDGDDFGASPLYDTTGFESAQSLLGFLTLKKGDTDDEYFDNYTPEQLAFSESWECESLQLYCNEEFTFDEYMEQLRNVR